MKTSRLIAVSLFAALGVSSLQAQTTWYPSNTGYYTELGYSALDLKVSGGETSTPQIVRLTVGKELHKYLAVEGMYATTASRDTKPTYSGEYTGYGLMLKPKMALTDSTEIFARLGWSRSDITASAAGATTGSDVLSAAGIQTKFTPNVFGQIDYTNYFHRSGIKAQGWGISLGVHF
jgi:opacity protein-like surface antigen